MAELSFLKEGLKYAPSMIGIIAIVFMFLRYLHNKEERDRQDFDKRDKTIQLISTQAFEIHKKSNEVIEKNSVLFGEMKHTIEMCGKRQ